MPILQPLSPLPDVEPLAYLEQPLRIWARDLAQHFEPGSPLLFEQAWFWVKSNYPIQSKPSWLDFREKVLDLLAQSTAYAAMAPSTKQHSYFAPYRILAPDGWQVIQFANLADSAYAAWHHDWELGQKQQTIDQQEQKLKSEIAKTTKSISLLEEKLAEYANEVLWRQEAEAILIWGESARGNDTIILPNPYGGTDLVIQLDPAHTPHQEAEQRFTKARKAARGRQICLIRLTKMRSRYDELGKQFAALSRGEDIETELEVPIIRSKTATKTQPATTAKSRVARIFTSSDGLEILVGKGAAENEEVTFKWGRGNDLWLHARNREGAHVIVKLSKEGSIPPRTLEEAAGLAAYFSKGRQEKAVEVIYTRRKYVTRRKHMPRGAVLVSQEKVYYARPALPPTSQVEET